MHTSRIWHMFNFPGSDRVLLRHTTIGALHKLWVTTFGAPLSLWSALVLCTFNLKHPRMLDRLNVWRPVHGLHSMCSGSNHNYLTSWELAFTTSMMKQSSEKLWKHCHFNAGIKLKICITAKLCRPTTDKLGFTLEKTLIVFPIFSL